MFLPAVVHKRAVPSLLQESAAGKGVFGTEEDKLEPSTGQSVMAYSSRHNYDRYSSSFNY